MNTPTRDEARGLLDECNSQILKCERGMEEAYKFGLEDSLFALLEYRIKLAGLKGKLEYMLMIF